MIISLMFLIGWELIDNSFDLTGKGQFLSYYDVLVMIGKSLDVEY